MVSSQRLSPTSYIVLGLLAREGPQTPYELERHVNATIGNFWSFPHTLLYTEPPRLAAIGMVTESREHAGRRRRIFEITSTGSGALRAWLDEPSGAPTELRDLGLLQHFFADLAPASSRVRVAEQQLAMHVARLEAYEENRRLEHEPEMPGQRTIEHWRGATLTMGVLYEAAAIEFWAGVVANARAADESTARDEA